MNREIKEILDDLKKYANEGGEHKLMEYEIKHIQCYITNLQEERDFYKCTDNMNVESNIELRARIDKAIEYIKTFRNKFTDRMPFLDMRWFDIQYLLNILKGSE